MADALVETIRTEPAWRRAVWSLRAGFVGLAMVLSGVVTLGGSRSVGLTLIALGTAIWVGCSMLTIASYFAAVRPIPEPRPGFWTLRWVLIADAFRRGPASS